MWFVISQVLLLLGISFVDCQSFNTDLNTVLGCAPKTNSLSKGFSVSYYHYPLIPSGSSGCYVDDRKTFLTDEYLHGGYATYGGGLIGSSTGVTNLTFHFHFPGGCLRPILGSLPSNYNNPPQFSMSNFSMLITGYFFAPKTGLYDFAITSGDDVMDINMGDGKAFGCCQLESTISNPAPFDISVVWPSSTGSGSFNLVGGYYYPLRILYINRYYEAIIAMSFKDPDGVVHNDFDGYVFTISDGEKCPAPVATTTLPWTFQSTTTGTAIGTTTGVDGEAITEDFIVVRLPHIETAIAINTPWTGTYTTTVATATTTVTGSDRIPTIETIFSVETPQVETATTINAGWTGTYTTTYSTDFVTVTGIDGIITLQTVYHVQTPTVKLSKFDNLSRTSNYTQAYSTNAIATTGTDGVPTVHPTFSFDASEIGSTSTVISPWTGTYTNTYSTELVTATGTDGIITVQAVYHVKTPSTGTTNTKKSAWISNYIQTYPTGGIGSSSADGVSNVQTAIHVKTGEAGNAIKINIPWTGTYTTTYSTGAFTSTGSNGIHTVQTAFYVKTPEMGFSSFGYSNSSSTTSHSTDSNGNKNLQSETSKPLVKVSVTSGIVMGHSMAETNLPISQETSSNRPTTSKNDDGPVPERGSTANINTPLGTTMNVVGETSGAVSGMLDTETKGKQSKTMSISVGQPVTVSSATSKATSPQPSLNPSIPTFTPSISGASQTATFETRLEDKANKILISPLVIILLAFL